MPHLKPPTGEVGEALKRVLGSATFARSGRARDLLRYLVSREQSGEAESLKGYSIALDVFGRDDEFDPSTDAVVRVQARRMRDLLSQYYEREGAHDPLRIDVPLGSYTPCYSHAAAADIPAANAAPPPLGVDTSLANDAENRGYSGSSGDRSTVRRPPGQTPAGVLRHLRLFWIAMSAVIVLLGFVAYRVGFGVPEAAPSDMDEGGVTASIRAWLPAVHVKASQTDGEVGKVAAILAGALTGFDTIEYIARPYEMPDTVNERKAEFLFLVSQIAGDSHVRVDLRHAPTSRSLVAREVDPGNAEDIIADLATSVAPVSGAIYAFISNNGLQTPLTSCLLLNDYYYRDPGEELFISAFECMRRLEKGGLRSPLVYSELASLELQGIVSKYEYAADFTREGAMNCARKAIQIGPTSPYAHRAHGYLLLRLGNDSKGLDWMRKAYVLNRYDLSMAASYAYALVFSGIYDEAVPILERAVRASSAHPGWWDYALFLAFFMTGELEKAADATLAFETTKRAHYLAARMIVAHNKGDQTETDELRSEIVEQFPVFASDPRKFFTDAQYPQDLVGKFVEAISAAGLVSAS